MLCNTQTIFQSRLSEVLYEDSTLKVGNLNFFNDGEEFINGLRNFEEKVLEEVTNIFLLNSPNLYIR